MPRCRAAATTGSNRSNVPSTDAPTFAWANASVADVNKAMASAFASSARSKPL
jgi:hypothetical protein